MRIRKENDFLSMFDEETGRYLRTGIIRDGKDTGEDPFMSSFPELLDVGIMGHCKHGKGGLCMKAGIECYQDGLHAEMPNMRLQDFKELVGQCRERPISLHWAAAEIRISMKHLRKYCGCAGTRVLFRTLRPPALE